MKFLFISSLLFFVTVDSFAQISKFSAIASPKYAWLKTDGTAIDAKVFNTYLDTCTAGTILMEAKSYLFEGQVKFPSNKTIIGTQGATIFKYKKPMVSGKITSLSLVGFMNKNARDNQTISLQALDSNIVIKGITFLGYSQNDYTQPTGFANTVCIDNAKDVKFIDCTFEKAENDGLVFVYCNNAQAINCVAKYNRKAGFYWSGCKNSAMLNCQSYQNVGRWKEGGGSGMGCDIVSDGFTVTNYQAYQNSGGGFYATNSKDLSISASNIETFHIGAEDRNMGGTKGCERVALTACTLKGVVVIHASSDFTMTGNACFLSGNYGGGLLSFQSVNASLISNNNFEFQQTGQNTPCFIEFKSLGQGFGTSNDNVFANNLVIDNSGAENYTLLRIEKGSFYNDIRGNIFSSNFQKKGLMVDDENKETTGVSDKNNWIANTFKRKNLSYNGITKDGLE